MGWGEEGLTTTSAVRSPPPPLFPQGWDKTFCLRYLPEDAGDMHFFGDKTFEGGNDFEIFSHPRVIGHTVNGPDDTERQCRALFLQ